jgi:hypothetical protein
MLLSIRDKTAKGSHLPGRFYFCLQAQRKTDFCVTPAGFP